MAASVAAVGGTDVVPGRFAARNIAANRKVLCGRGAVKRQLRRLMERRQAQERVDARFAGLHPAVLSFGEYGRDAVDSVTRSRIVRRNRLT